MLKFFFFEVVDVLFAKLASELRKYKRVYIVMRNTFF
jgi:hypothetical protein